MATLGANIIVPLQPHEIQARLNNSPYYHRHFFKCSGRSLEGLHPYPIRHIAMLSSEERAELLSQCEDIELHWNLDTPRDEKWRYMKTRETLGKWPQHDFCEDQSAESVPEGKSPLGLARYPRVQKALEERGSVSSVKIQPARLNFLTPDELMSERDRVLDVIAPSTVPTSVSKMNIKTASDEELLHAADMFKTSADQIEQKLGFLSPAFSQNSNVGVLRTAMPKSTQPANSPPGVPDDSSKKPLGRATRDPHVKEQHLQNRKGKSPKGNAPIVRPVDNVANESLRKFQGAVAAAAQEDPLRVAAAMANWEITTSHPKISTSTDTEHGLSADPMSQSHDGATTTAHHSRDADACTVESLDNLADSDDDYATSHQPLDMDGFLSEGSDAMSEFELLPEQVKDTSDSIASTTESLHTMAPASDHEGNSLFDTSIQATTYPPHDEGTHTPEVPELIMPGFALSPTSEALHEFVSDHAFQILHGPGNHQTTNATATDRSASLERSIPVPHYVTPVADPVDRVTIELDDVAPAHVHLDDLVHEAVVSPKDNKDRANVRLEKPFKAKPGVPSLLNLDGEQIDDWAQDVLTAIDNHKFSYLAASQQEPPTESPHAATEAINDDHNKVSDNGHVVEAQMPKEETPEPAVQPTTTGALAAVKKFGITSENWTSFVHLASQRPLIPRDPLATPAILRDCLQPHSIYPLPVYQEHAESHSKPPLVRYLRVAVDHLSSICYCYVIISFFEPSARAPGNLYLAAGALLGGAWAILYYFQRKTDKPCAVRVANRSKSTTKKQFIKVFATLSAVAAVAAAVAYGLWPTGKSGKNSVAVFRNRHIRTEMVDICSPKILNGASVVSAYITCDANTPDSGIVVPQDSPVDGDTDESDSKYNSGPDNVQTSKKDSHGAPNVFAKHDYTDWTVPLLGLGISVMVSVVKHWWVQSMFEVHLQNHP